MTRSSHTRAHIIARAAAFVLALTVGGAACAVEWIELGPAPITSAGYTGRVSAIACSPTDPDRYFVAGADGGVWRSTDGGSTWTPLTDDMPTTAIGALAIDPVNENVIYAGTGEANYANHSRYGLGLYKSTDGGDTWQVLAADVFSGRCFSKIAINNQNPQRIYASITRAGGFPELAAAKGHPGAAGALGVFRSDDGGVTWTHLTNGLPTLSATDLAIDIANPSVLYAGIGRIFGSFDNGVYKTTDGGDSWTKLAGGLPEDDFGRVSVATAPSDSARVYALITNQSDSSGGGASMRSGYRSDDAGATWTALSLGNMQSSYGWYLSVIGVHPSDPDLVLMGGVTFHRSTNSGGQWSTVTPPHVDMHAVAWDAAGRMVAGDDGGVHRSSDNGSTWESLNDGLGLIQCYAGLSIRHPGGQNVYIVGLQDNGTVRRNTAGAWVDLIGGDGGWTQVNPQDELRVYGEYQGAGNLYRSTDGGTSFSYSGSGIATGDRHCFMPPYVINPDSPQRMLYATQRIYRSTNYGAAWSVVTDDLTGGGDAAIRAMAMAPTDPSTIYIASNDGRVMVTTDGLQNFDLILDNVPGWPRITRELFVHPTDPRTVYLATSFFNETQIRRTTDGGQTWQALDANFPDIPVNVVAVDVRGSVPVIYVGADAGLYRSINHGASWHRYGTGLPNAPVIDLRLQLDRGELIASTQGRGIWIIDVGLPGDMNGDGAVTAFDIDPFVLALSDPDEYANQFPDVDPVLAGDMDGDGTFNALDIDGFVQTLVGL